MPKEVIVQNVPNESLEFRWSKTHDDPQIGIDLNSPFVFVGEDEEYTSLFFTFESAKEIDKAIKVLKKMRKASF